MEPHIETKELRKIKLRDLVDTLNQADSLLLKHGIDDTEKRMANIIKNDLTKRILRKIHQFLVDYYNHPCKKVCGVKVDYIARNKINNGGFISDYHYLNYENWMNQSYRSFSRIIDNRNVEIGQSCEIDSWTTEYNIDVIDEYYKWMKAKVTASDLKYAKRQIERGINDVDKRIQSLQKLHISMEKELALLKDQKRILENEITNSSSNLNN